MHSNFTHTRHFVTHIFFRPGFTSPILDPRFSMSIQSSILDPRSSILDSILRFSVLDPRFLIPRFSILDSRFDPRFSILDSRFSILDPRSSILDSRSSILDSRFSILDSRSSILDSRFSILNSRFSILDPRSSIVDSSILDPSILDPQFSIFDPRSLILYFLTQNSFALKTLSRATFYTRLFHIQHCHAQPSLVTHKQSQNITNTICCPSPISSIYLSCLYHLMITFFVLIGRS